MKLKEYIDNLQKLLLEHGNLELIYASDPEGNSFCRCLFQPGIMYAPKEHSFYSAYSSLDECEEEIDIALLEKVVCVN